MKSFIEELSQDILNNKYFIELFEKIEINAAYRFFNLEYTKINDKELVDILRFADILSHSKDYKLKNYAYKIISLLVDDFKENKTFLTYVNSVLVKLGNFPAIKFLSEQLNSLKKQSFEVLLEKAVKETYQQVPNSELIFTDSQFKIFENLKNNNHFSFSGPTSLGKSFIINVFVKYLVEEHKGTDNVIILVPTRALITQTVLDLKKQLRDNQQYKILSHPTIPSLFRNEDNKYIFVFTPERMISYLSDITNPKIDYLFIDEAQKIIKEKDTRSPLYYHAILQAERKSIKLFFSSPNISNPEVFLKIFEKSTDEKIHIQTSPVSQNRYFVDFIEKKCLYFSDLNTEIEIPINLDSKDFFSWLKTLSEREQRSIIYCNTIADTIEYARKFSLTLPEKNDEKIEEVIDVIKSYLHKQYFLIECLRKGVAYHFGSLPQRIREKIEELFVNKKIDYVFCTSTLLEGVNLPAKNIFILNNATGTTKFSDIDFWNLASRAGRLTKELSGNIICARVEDKQNRWNKPDRDLIVVKNKEVKNIKPVIIKGQKNFFKNLELALKEKEFTNKNASNNEKNVWKHFSNIALIHEIKNDESVLRANFIDRNPNAKTTLKNQKKKLTIPEKILSRSSMIKAKYQNNLFNKENIDDYKLPTKIDYQTISNYLKKISIIYNWKSEEVGGRKPLYKSDNILEYYSHLMNDWINSKPLNFIISNTIKYYINKGSIWYNGSELPFDSKSPFHINIIINQVISDVDNLLRFKIKNYFENYYMILEERLGVKNTGANWAEYLEYGTSDFKIIELQSIGLTRYLAQYVLKKHKDCFSFRNRFLTKMDKEKLLHEMDKNIPEYVELKKLLD